MPYILQEERDRLDKHLFDLKTVQIENAGQLNYVITQLVQNSIRNWGGNYQAMDEVIGALECCKLELYRRKIAPYEDTKIRENGDV